jgi:molybdopterin-binding protein
VSQPKLSLRDVLVRRGKADIVRIPHLDVLEGEVLVIIGPNGAGKSVLLETLALLQRPTKGKVLFKGRPVARRELALRRRMAVVFQDPLLLRRSVADNVAVGLRLRGVSRSARRERTAHWMRRFGIAHLAGRSGPTLSGGEAQRTSLARAFALEPEVLLLDEPFSALDQPMREGLLEDLSAVLSETGVTTVFVTHDRNEAMYLGGRMIVLMNGEIRQVGPTAEVFASPVDAEVAAFVGVETMVPARTVAVSDGLARLEVACGQIIEAVADEFDSPEALVCLRPEDVVLSPVDGAVPTSARNRLRGTIRRVSAAGPLARVTVDCGFPLIAVITNRSLEELGLTVGQDVVASFKASAVHVIPRSGRESP